MHKESVKERLHTGNLIKCYGSTYLLSINDASSIDRIRFSIVPIGNGGKDAIDFYLPMRDALTLVTEITTHVAHKKIAEDNGNYPSAYRYVTGVNGSKRLVIGGGKVGIRVMISDNTEQKRTYMTAISRADLEEFAFLFKLCYGLMNVLPDTYYGDLYMAFRKREKYHFELSESDTQEDSQE